MAVSRKLLSTWPTNHLHLTTEFPIGDPHKLYHSSNYVLTYTPCHPDTQRVLPILARLPIPTITYQDIQEPGHFCVMCVHPPNFSLLGSSRATPSPPEETTDYENLQMLISECRTISDLVYLPRPLCFYIACRLWVCIVNGREKKKERKKGFFFFAFAICQWIDNTRCITLCMYSLVKYKFS